MANIHMTGADELAKLLSELPVKIEVKMMRGGLRAGAVKIANDAKRRVAVSSGKLRDSIKIRTGKNRSGKVSAWISAGDRSSPTSAWYAHLIEYGVKPHAIIAKKKGALSFKETFSKSVKHPGFVDKPFLRPAFVSQAGNAVEAMANYLRKRIEKEASKK